MPYPIRVVTINAFSVSGRSLSECEDWCTGGSVRMECVDDRSPIYTHVSSRENVPSTTNINNVNSLAQDTVEFGGENSVCCYLFISIILRPRLSTQAIFLTRLGLRWLDPSSAISERRQILLWSSFLRPAIEATFEHRLRPL